MSEKLGKQKVATVTLDDYEEDATCCGEDSGIPHAECEFELVQLRLVNARAADCPRCAIRHVSFWPTIIS